jgi:PIN domain nuclease of toxin-antitoxin system
MSRLLLDTCTFLWLNSDPDQIPERVRKLCADESNRLYLSAVTAWEVAAKHYAGRLPLPVPPGEYIATCRASNGTISLKLREEDVFQMAKLPAIHKDPFDRMLICQAIARGLTIVTPDPDIARYPIPVIW